MGHSEIVGKKIDGLGDAFGSRGRYVDALAAILIGGCTDVPAVNAVTGPGAADDWDSWTRIQVLGGARGERLKL